MRRIPSSGQKFSCVNSPVKKPSVFNSLFARPLVLDIGYDIKNMQKSYRGADAKTAHLPKGTSFASLPPASALGHPWPSDVHIDHYGRTVPKPAHGSVNLGEYTSSSKLILDAMEKRAAQFSPFAAMVGHDAAIRETARLTEEQMELT